MELQPIKTIKTFPTTLFPWFPYNPFGIIVRFSEFNWLSNKICKVHFIMDETLSCKSVTKINVHYFNIPYKDFFSVLCQFFCSHWFSVIFEMISFSTIDFSFCHFILYWSCWSFFMRKSFSVWLCLYLKLDGTRSNR